ncbi:MAG TPA: hypothetical protein VNT22_10010 [Baekduia sp.]|nr:hypothetical protein [Baekduia sp.]
MSAQPASDAPEAEPSPRRKTVRVLLVLGVVLGVIALLSVWVNRQLLNHENWADTSTAVLEDRAVSEQMSTFLVDQAYANVDVAALVESGLPPRAKPLAGPVAGGLRTLSERATLQILQRPRVQQAWRVANDVTAKQFLAIAEGDSEVITTSNGALIIDLRPIVLQVVQRLGLPGSVTDRIPPSAGALRVMDSDQVESVGTLVRTLRVLAFILPVLVIGLFALAIYLARGRRRKVLFAVGLDFVLIGLIVLIARNMIGDVVVDALAKTDAVRPAADAVWSTGTEMLRDTAQATIIFGIPVIGAAWIAGPSRLATGLRQWAAPWLRDEPAAAYAAVAALAALVILWGPIPATQKLPPVLGMLIAVVIGMEALRRQTNLEFPEASIEDSKASLRGLAGRVTGMGSRDRERHSSSPAAGQDAVARLERLTALHKEGAVDDREFRQAKAQILG